MALPKPTYGILPIVFITQFMILWLTLAPTIFTVDTPEFATNAHILGISHAPGYALYTLVSHVFVQLPLGEDIAFRLNVLSALSVAASVTLITAIAYHYVASWLVAAGTGFSFGLSYYVWASGLIAEVYSVQILCLSITLYWLHRLYQAKEHTLGTTLAVGGSFGVAVAMVPSSVLFAPALAAALLWLKLPLRWSLMAGGLCMAIFLASLAYFPIRHAADPALNIAGTYDTHGEFDAVNLQSVDGMVWLLTGQQFRSFFATDNLSLDPLAWLWRNYVGVGMVFGVLGIWWMFGHKRQLLGLWALAFLPFCGFFYFYGAEDKDFMLAPAYLLWLPMIVIGFHVFFAPKLLKVVPLGLATALLVVHFPLLDISDDDSVYRQAEVDMHSLPDNAVVFGYWRDIMPLTYLQLVEDRRNDLRLYNLFLFEYDRAKIDATTERWLAAGRPIIFLDDSGDEYMNAVYQTRRIIVDDLKSDVDEDGIRYHLQIVTEG